MDQWLLVFHVLGFLMWIGTLMALTQILAFHAMEDPPVQARLAVFEKKMIPVTWVGMFLSLATGIWIMAEAGWQQLKAAEVGPAFHIKLTLVALLMGVTFYVFAQAKKMSSTQEKVSPKNFKAVHGILNVLVLGILIAVLVVYGGR